MKKCEHINLTVRFNDTNKLVDVELICISCDISLWRDEAMGVTKFHREVQNILSALGYDDDGRRKNKTATKVRVKKTHRVKATYSEDKTDVVISDTELLMWRIDMALDNRDEVAFGLLVKELEGVE